MLVGQRWGGSVRLSGEHVSRLSFGPSHTSLAGVTNTLSWRCVRSCTFSNSFVSVLCFDLTFTFLGSSSLQPQGTEGGDLCPALWVRSPFLSDMVCISDSPVRCSPSTLLDSALTLMLTGDFLLNLITRESLKCHTVRDDL